jgi:hypothetical protein
MDELCRASTAAMHTHVAVANVQVHALADPVPEAPHRRLGQRADRTFGGRPPQQSRRDR